MSSTMHPTKLLICLIMALGYSQSPVHGQTQPSAPAPKIKFDETKFSFGRVLAGTKIYHEFTFTNVGDAELVISNIKPTCGCTIFTEWSKNVPPGGKGTIPMEFNSTNMKGVVQRNTIVHSNDPATPVSVLSIDGVVWQYVEVSPNIALIHMPPYTDQNFSTTLKIINQVEEPLKLEAPVCSSSEFKARIEEVTAGKEFNLIIDTVPPLPAGNLRGMITVDTSSKEVPQLKIPFLAISQPDVVVYPPQMFLPAVPPDFPEPYIITVRNQSPDPITVTNLSCDAPASTVEIREIVPGKEFHLVVAFPDDLRAIPGKTFTISADTSSPKFPKISIPVAFAGQ